MVWIMHFMPLFLSTFCDSICVSLFIFSLNIKCIYKRNNWFAINMFGVFVFSCYIL
jgi:hypothetical protein